MSPQEEQQCVETRVSQEHQRVGGVVPSVCLGTHSITESWVTSYPVYVSGASSRGRRRRSLCVSQQAPHLQRVVDMVPYVSEEHLQ